VGDRAPRKLSRPMLAEVIEPARGLFQFTVGSPPSGFEELISSGVVITGGSAQLQGITDLGEEVFHMPVRIGIPAYMGGLADVVKSPRYATAVGLLLEGREQFLRGEAARAQVAGIGGAAERMKQWFKANF
jgi:cell division protein FtsA